jgi:hypothetical protein
LPAESITAIRPHNYAQSQQHFPRIHNFLKCWLDSTHRSAQDRTRSNWKPGWLKCASLLSKTGFLDTREEAYRDVLKQLPCYARAIQSNLPFPWFPRQWIVISNLC